MPDPRYPPPTRDEEVVTCADTGARIVVSRPGTWNYDKHVARPADREADLLVSRALVERLERDAATGAATPAGLAHLEAARRHLDDLRAEPRHPLLGPSASEMVGRFAVVAGDRAKAEAA